jgi:acyl-CoA reductase-like NAD-dependent aldehyde dehydrogenase
MEYPIWIGGEPVYTAQRKKIEIPYDGAPIAEVCQADAATADAAAAAAHRAAKEMREMPLAERASILRRVHQAVVERKETLAHILSSESGKPIREARLELDRAAQTLLFSAEEAHRVCGEVVPADAAPAGKGRWAMTLREPLGVIAAITPFNFPLNLSVHKIGPAIAAGNAVVHKPASATPMIALELARIFHECGLPAGALNVIPGSGGAIGDLLVQDPRVAMITFTGSPEVGLRIRSLAGMKRVTLELGSNSAVMVAEDADLEEAVPRCITGAFANSGQVCISVQRIYVQEQIAAEFVERMVEGARALKIGHPHDAETQISSLITVQEAERVESWIAEAVQAGARLLTGGARRRATVEPAVLTDVPPTVKISCQEAFGPLVAINRYRTLEEAIAMVNDSVYGLQASIFTRDLRKAFQAAREVHVGGFLINEAPSYRLDQMPYGGVKLSGTGREGPRYAIQEMTECKLVLWR